jgi:uncharacterized protein (DUF1015 family)
MPKVIPFNGLLFNCDRVAANNVIAPPYDIISPEYKEVLYSKSPYNIVRIDFGRELPEDSAKDNKYTRARVLLEQWIKEQILVKDRQPAFYAYEMEYTLRGRKKTLKGVFGLVEIVELGKGVWPHEETRAKPKADRMEIMRHCMSNLSPVYAIYNSPEKVTAGILDSLNNPPYMDAVDADGTTHRLIRISDPAKTALISNELSNKPLFIADGHHRYEVALEFKKEMDQKTNRTDDKPRPWDYVLMFLADMADSGITILPTHRMVKGISSKDILLEKLKSDFDISELPAGEDISRRVLGDSGHTFGMYLETEKKWFVLKYGGGELKGIHSALQSLDVVILRELILNREPVTDLAYEMRVEVAVDKARNGEYDAVFFVKPSSAADIERVASADLRMPAKSTYFYPKLMTGMVINKFETA